MDDTVIPEDQDPTLEEDVEGHGLLRNAAVAAALTVGGGAALASPASADALDATHTRIEAVVGDSLAAQVGTLLTARYELSVPPENLTLVLSQVPDDVKATGSEGVVAYLDKTFGGTDGLVAAIGDRTSTDRTLASQLATLLTAQFDLSVPPENLTMVLDAVPTDVKTVGAESVVTFLEKTYGGTAELVTGLRTALA